MMGALCRGDGLCRVMGVLCRGHGGSAGVMGFSAGVMGALQG